MLNKIIKFIEDSIIVNYTKSSSEFEISLLEIDVLNDTSLKLDYNTQNNWIIFPNNN